MPIFSYNCSKCGKFEELFLTFKEANERANKIKCPKCGKKSEKEEFEMPARFSGTFGENGTAPSKRHSYKKVMGGERGNKGSAI